MRSRVALIQLGFRFIFGVLTLTLILTVNSRQAFGGEKETPSRQNEKATKIKSPAQDSANELSALSVAAKKIESSIELIKGEIEQVIKTSQSVSNSVVEIEYPMPFGDLNATALMATEKVSLVNTVTHTEIVPVFYDNNLVFKVRYDAEALKHPQYILRDLTIVSALVCSRIDNVQSSLLEFNYTKGTRARIRSKLSVAELLTNANEGSPSAKLRWTQMQISILNSVSFKDQTVFANLNLDSSALSDAATELENELPLLEKTSEQFFLKQKKIWEKWKKDTGVLERLEALDQKLNDLILNNDRKAVRNLIETYLPWPMMEPVESRAWKLWLEAIEHPHPEKKTIAFRGVSYETDKIQRRMTDHGEVLGFMSSVLTMNQGSYTRRLRSLSTNRLKNGDTIFYDTEKTQAAHSFATTPVKITDQVDKHSGNPVASNFISFTYSPSVALRFVGRQVGLVPYGGLLAVAIDSRRMIPNLGSVFPEEMEILAPLIVFPDEVVAYREVRSGEYDVLETFIKDVNQKKGQNAEIWLSEQRASSSDLARQYRRGGYDVFKAMMEKTDRSLSLGTCERVFTH